ncbi:putative metallo-aminopeptidase [Clavispora lusitaniae]|uniref:Aminopeptidase n=1 Tax=Clavispora lusitaniae TaxID=36911 RepID=A0AA91T1T0_CLALS|nr:putative metallo-aminopeptidase [Clavispora lusitaniae]
MSIRISETVNCFHYDLTFTVDPKSEHFTCDEDISLEVLESSDHLTLNVQKLEILSAQWNGSPVDYNVNEQKRVLVIHRELVAGERAKLSVRCVGAYSQDMYGIYKSSYTYSKSEDTDRDIENENIIYPKIGSSTAKDNDEPACLPSRLSSLVLSEKHVASKKKLLVSTQFEPIGARRAFPCIDDPARKSHFTVTLVHPTSLVALSNCPVIENEYIDSYWSRTKFERSPLMSTYLVAFVVGELESLKSEKLPITIWTLPGGAEDAYFALEAAERCLPFYEEIFDYEFPLKKLDMVAIPDFAKSAMENFGLITFKESDLLIGANATQYRKEIAFETVAHEISHQWFGNLVTMEFWDDLWLNEGFATWMSWYAMDHFHSDWNVWENYIIYTLSTALLVDGRLSSHPIVMQIRNFNDIEQAGDDITYKKGCAIVVMLFSFLGEGVFFTGLKKYIQRFAWKNAKSSDLWNCLADASGEKIDILMQCWTSRPGYPIVTVEELGEGHLRLTQKRCVSSGNTDGFCKPFMIPLTIETSGDPLSFIFEDKSIELQIPSGSYHLNPGHFGYYVTSYPSTRWSDLSNLEVTTKDRIGMILDCEMASSGGEISIIPFLQLAEQIPTLKNPILFDAMIESYFDLMDTFLCDARLWTGLCSFGQFIIKEHVSTCYSTAKDELGNLAQFKRSVFRFAAYVRAPEINGYCDSEFCAFINDEGVLDPEEARIILRNVIRRTDDKNWNDLWNLFQKEDDEYVKEDILASLGYSRSESVLSKYLDYILHSDLIKPQDMSMCLMPMANTLQGVDLLWNWLRNSWDELSSKLGEGSVIHLEVIEACLSRLCTEDHLEQLTLFFSKDDKDVFESIVAKSEEKIKSKITKFHRNRSVISWLASRNFLAE